MEGEFWSTIKADVLPILTEAGAHASEWAMSDVGTATIFGVLAGLVVGWIVVGLYFRRVRRRLDWLSHRLESSAVHLETAVDQLRTEILSVNLQLEEALKRQSESADKRPSADRLPEPISDFGEDWTQVVAGTAKKKPTPENEP